MSVQAASPYLNHPPLAPVSLEQGVCCWRSPGARRVVGELVWASLGGPVLDDRVDETPCPMNPIGARKQGLIALHRIVQQPLIGTWGFINTKGVVVTKGHGDGSKANVRPGLLGHKGVNNALVRLQPEGENVAIKRFSVVEREHEMRRWLELDGHFRQLLGQAFAGAKIKWYAGPAPVVESQLQRGKRRGA